MSRPLYDAQAAMGFVIGQTTHVEAAVNETIYPDIQYPNLIPVDTSAHPFTQTVTYYSADKFGKADWINGNADDIPIAGNELTKFQTAVYTAGIGYAYGWEEVGVAMMMGYGLQDADAKSARRAYEEMVDRVAISGDTAKGFQGLVNNSAITPVAATYGDWGGSATTEGMVLSDINDAILATATSTLYASVANTLLLPNTKINYLSTARLGTNSDATILEFLRKNNTYTALTGQPLTIRGVHGLETAGAGGTARMVAYRKDPDVLKMHIPMPHRFLPVYQAGPLRWEVPGVFRLGGLDIRRPLEVKYRDGI